MVLIFIMPAFAGKPTTNQTEIINTLDNPVPITTEDQIEVFVVNESAKKSVISEYMELVTANLAYLIMIVPTDKEFILTDIVSGNTNAGMFTVWENGDIKIRAELVGTNNPYSIHLTSGIPFSPGSNVYINAYFSGSPLYLTITGYLLDHLDQ